MKIFNYDSESGVFLYESEAALDILESRIQKEDRFLIPAHATIIKPTLQEGKISKFDIINQKWVLEDVIEAKPYKQTAEEEKKQLQDQLINSRKHYLQTTDWYIAKEFDEPGSYPIEIKNKRTLARREIAQISQESSMEILREFINNF